jgi:predicted nucleic acid-binding protein
MILASDTGPLNYLILIGEVQALPQLFSRIIFPESVLAELRHAAAPDEVRVWIKGPPPWINVLEPTTRGAINRKLTLADQEVISLARELQVPLLMDDRRARLAASVQGIRLIGTIGILELTSARGILNLQSALARLDKTTHRHSTRLVEDAIKRDQRRKS